MIPLSKISQALKDKWYHPQLFIKISLAHLLKRTWAMHSSRILVKSKSQLTKKNRKATLMGWTQGLTFALMMSQFKDLNQSLLINRTLPRKSILSRLRFILNLFKWWKNCLSLQALSTAPSSLLIMISRSKIMLKSWKTKLLPTQAMNHALMLRS